MPYDADHLDHPQVAVVVVVAAAEVAEAEVQDHLHRDHRLDNPLQFQGQYKSQAM